MPAFAGASLAVLYRQPPQPTVENAMKGVCVCVGGRKCVKVSADKRSGLMKSARLLLL